MKRLSSISGRDRRLSADAAHGTSDLENPISQERSVLVAQGLRVRYQNGAIGIVNVSFRVEAGQIVALFGPNGAGKSTSVRAVSGFLRSEGARVVGGSVELFGAELTNCEPHRFCSAGVAVVPERRKVFPNLSVMDNLKTASGSLSGSQRAAAIGEAFDLFPMLAPFRTKPAGQLSGGQRQMLAIGRALMSQPRILIIDELTLGLHSSLHAPLFEAVRAISRDGASVLLVDESTGFALKVADYCYLIRGGEIQSSGPPSLFGSSELLASGYIDE